VTEKASRFTAGTNPARHSISHQTCRRSPVTESVESDHPRQRREADVTDEDVEEQAVFEDCDESEVRGGRRERDGGDAVVATTLDDDSVPGGRVAIEWLVAPDGREWRLVWF
jgi:hypothetical protein